MSRRIPIAILLLIIGCHRSGSLDLENQSSSHKRFFVSSGTTTGDIAGLAGGDAFCLAAATSAGLGGSWKAWLSDSSTDAVSRLTDVSPWYRVDNTTVVFPNFAALSSAGALAHFTDEHGTADPGFNAWTGTSLNGHFSGQSCSDWTDATSASHGTDGVAEDNPFPIRWTNENIDICLDPFHLYCFEQ